MKILVVNISARVTYKLRLSINSVNIKDINKIDIKLY